MKKSFLFLVAGLILSGSAMAQKDKKKGAKKEVTSVSAVAPATTTSLSPDQEKKQEGTEALWLNETTHDFGKIPQGKPVTTDFELKNNGKDSLKLEMVQASCGCTTPNWKPGPYAPGENFKINVGYNAAGEGAFQKQVTITYNGGQQKVIFITGNVFATPSTPAPENKEVSKVKE